MMELTKERLMALSNRENVGAICGDEIAAIARQLLAGMEQGPVAYMYKDRLHTDARFSLHTRFDNWSQEDINEYEITEIPLYAAPQLPQTAVPDEAEMPSGPGVSEYNVGWANGWNSCREEMLPGAEPVRQPDELQSVVLHMGQAMSVFEALKKELISEHVRHAELGAMGAVNVQTWTSVIGGISLQYESSNGGCTLRVIPAAPQQEVK